MNYTQGNLGRVFVARLVEGESLYDAVEQIAWAEKVECGVVFAIGGMRRGRVVTGPEDPTGPIVPHIEEFEDARELVGIGTLFPSDGEPDPPFSRRHREGEDGAGGVSAGGDGGVSGAGGDPARTGERAGGADVGGGVGDAVVGDSGDEVGATRWVAQVTNDDGEVRATQRVAPTGHAMCKCCGKKIPVILDTDIGYDIDDTWALALLLKSPEVDLKLVVSATHDSVYGAKLLAKFLAMAGRADIPVGVGSSSTTRWGGRRRGWRIISSRLIPARCMRTGWAR